MGFVSNLKLKHWMDSLEVVRGHDVTFVDKDAIVLSVEIKKNT